MSPRVYKSGKHCLQRVLSKYVRKENFTDVTLVSDDFQTFRAHKLVVSAYSPVLERLLLLNTTLSSEHTVLHVRGFHGRTIQKMLKFMYFGEVDVESDEEFDINNLFTELNIADHDIQNEKDNESNEVINQVDIMKIKAQHKILIQENISLELLDDENKGKETNDQNNSIEVKGSDMVGEELIFKVEEVESEQKRKPLEKYFKRIEGVDSIFECVFCSESYTKKKILNKHTRQKHSDATIFKCKVCHKNYNSLFRLESHFHAYHRDPVWQCRGCHFTNGNQNTVKNHYLNHHNTKYTFPCKQCDYVAKHQWTLNYHVKRIHEDKTERFKCDDCGVLVRNLYCHRESKHLRIKYPCSRCPFQASSKAYLMQHETSVHDGIKMKCEHCDYTGSKTATAAHVKVVHEGIRFNCEHCPIKFRAKSQWKLHQRKKHNIKHFTRDYQRDYELFMNNENETQSTN